MRTRTKAALALTVAIGALLTTAIVAAAGSDTPTHESAGDVFTDPTGGSSGPSTGGSSDGQMPVDPIAIKPCGELTDGSGPDGTVSYTPCPGDGSSYPTPVPTPLEPTPGMDHVHPRGWDASAVSDDGTAVTLTYYTGVAPCSMLDHVDVTYGTDTITITVFEGSDPDAKDVACIDIAMLASTTVRLDQPLGGRQIVDGAQS